uniref:Cytochrome P450 n=1 Tax=Sciurus vulgaris TaxID=55149 RepID=A0A8D2DN02_SCIVU
MHIHYMQTIHHFMSFRLAFKGFWVSRGILGPDPWSCQGVTLLPRSFPMLREKYGDVFTVYLGPRPVVVLCGTEAIREALVDQAEDFSGWGTLAIIEPIVQEYGVVFANGERWKTLRRFSLATMRDFGMGKWSIEERIQEEAQCLVEELRKSKGENQGCTGEKTRNREDPTFLFQSITANIICSIVFGERFDYKDQEFLRLLDMIYQSFALISSFSSQVFELYSDVLKHFPGTHRQVYKNLQEVITFINHSVEKHHATLGPSNPRDFIHSYLLRMDKEKSNAHSEFHHKNLTLTLLSLFAGTETTSTTLRYGFLFMFKYPHVAETVQKEIEQVTGSHRPPALEDHSRMPYTEAVIHEIQRFTELIPIGVPHVVTKDTYFRGFIIPKNTEVYPILNAFNPDHFLDAHGALKKNEAFIPFSMGKRICLGEGIARNELPVAPEDIDLTPRESGVGRVPPKYQIRFLPH